jgi:uncharacterized membrane protein YfcA
LAIAFFVVAAVYGSVGHAGASGYLAVMALLDVPSEQMKPLALALNIVVALISTANFRAAGIFYPRQLLPFVLTSAPLAFMGGAVHASWTGYRPLLAGVLFVAAARMMLSRPTTEPEHEQPVPNPPPGPSLLAGGAIGLLSGLTGTGGGIFLTPLMLHMRWATIRQSAGLSAPFILINSLAGLAGSTSTAPALTPSLLRLVVIAAAGGAIGSWLGARRLPERALLKLLGVVLLVAAFKLVAS